MRPLAQWIAVVPNQRILSSYLWVPKEVPQHGEFRIDTVQAVGDGVQEARVKRKLEVNPGDHVIYSARVDGYRIGDDWLDLIEEGSVLGHCNG